MQKDLARILTEEWPTVAKVYQPETLRQLAAAYDEPHRSYHSAEHIIVLLEKMKRNASLAKKPELIVHAILWHDAVYRTHEKNADGSISHRADALNVEESAQWFQSVPSSLSPEDRASVAAMIRATSGHDVRLAKDHPDFNDTALFLDLDLSVLALPPDDFRAITGKIRFEYPHISDRDFCEGRAQFLDAYHAKPDLFFHPQTASQFEAVARKNMQREARYLRQQAARMSKPSKKGRPAP